MRTSSCGACGVEPANFFPTQVGSNWTVCWTAWRGCEIRRSGTSLLRSIAWCQVSQDAGHLAVELKRCGVSRVLLVDANYLTASDGFLQKLKADFHLDDAVRDCLRMDDDL